MLTLQAAAGVRSPSFPTRPGHVSQSIEPFIKLTANQNSPHHERAIDLDVSGILRRELPMDGRLVIH